MTPPGGHPSPAELEREPPSAEVAAHLDACVACRVERRLLCAGVPAGAGPVPPGLLDAARAAAQGRPPPGEEDPPPGDPPPGPAPGPRGLPADEIPDAPRYQLGALLGVGSSAEVHRAFDPALRRHVALKILTRHGPRARARFLAEARITAQLDHPNVVPVHHLGVTEDGRPYVAERAIRGVSLGEAVRAGRLVSVEARVDALRKVCAAVAYAHDHGVLHRDLKPDNVMVGELGEVQVVDWGLSGRLEVGAEPEPDDRFDSPAWRTRDGEVIGTPAWMSPEQARGERVDARADVYALGAILHFLVVGRPPVVAADPGEVLAAVAAGRVPSPREVDPRVPRELDAVVRRATAADPDARYPHVRALLEDLDAWIERRPLPHVGSSLGERLGKLAARYRVVLAAVGATVALGLLAAAGGAWRYAVDTGIARDAAEAEARRARAAERRALAGEAAAQVALADAARLDGRDRDASEALDRAEASLGAIGEDGRDAEWSRSALAARSATPLSACTPSPGHPVLSVAISPDGDAAIGLAADGTVATWDPADCGPGARVALGAAPVEGAVAWLADGPAAVAWVGAELLHLRPGAGEPVRVPLPEGLVAGGAPPDRSAVADLVLHPWGEGALVGGDGRWWTFRFGEPALRPERPWSGPPKRLRLVPGGRRVFAEVPVDDAMRPGLWDRATLEPRAPVWMAEEATADGRSALVTAPDGVRRVDLDTGATRWARAETPFGAAGVAPGDRFAWRGLVGVIRVYALADGAPAGQVVAPATQERVAASRDARVLLTWGDGPEVHGWLRPEPHGEWLAPEAPAERAPDLAASPDGRLLAVAGAHDGVGVDLLDLATRRRLRRIPTDAAVDALAFSPDGARLAATVGGEGVRVWDVATGAERWRWAGPADPAPVEWADDEVVTVDRTGALVVLAGADGAERRRAPVLSGPSWDVGVVPGARRVVVGGYADPVVLLVDLDTGAVVRRMDTGGARAQVSVSRDGAVAAVAGFDGDTVLWDLATGAIRGVLDAEVGVVGVDLSPDGAVAVTAGFEEQLAFWDVATGARLRTASLGGMGSRVLYTPGGRLFVVRRNWKVEEIPLDDHRRARAAVAALAGGPIDRARSFAALGWWERVLPELDRGPDDPLLRAQAWLALGRPDRAAEVARAAPDDAYRRVLENLSRPP